MKLKRVRCVNGCGLLETYSGGVCPFCGGMALSDEALERARRLAEQWREQEEVADAKK